MVALPRLWFGAETGTTGTATLGTNSGTHADGEPRRPAAAARPGPGGQRERARRPPISPRRPILKPFRGGKKTEDDDDSTRCGYGGWDERVWFMLCGPYMCRLLFVVCLFVFALYVSLHVLVCFSCRSSCVCLLRVWCARGVCGRSYSSSSSRFKPSSKVVSWLFVASILAQIPIGGFFGRRCFSP